VWPLRVLSAATRCESSCSVFSASALPSSTNADMGIRILRVIDRAGIFPQWVASAKREQENQSRRGVGWLMGLEPTTTGITIQGSTNRATATVARENMARPAGLEPATIRLEGGCS